MLKIILVGASGAMGRTLVEICKDNNTYQIVGGVAEKSTDEFCFPVYDKLDKIMAKADVLIDFSNRSMLASISEYASLYKIPVVFATTGFTEDDYKKIDELSKLVPIMQEGNYSLGINVMVELSKKLALALEDFDIEIVESHHNLKKDNPSGTANMIFEAVNEARGKKLNKVMRNFSHDDSRHKNDVGISSVRAGTIVGEHRLILAGVDEVIEVKHMAGSKKIFAIGALKAAKFLKDKIPGRYSFKEVIND